MQQSVNVDGCGYCRILYPDAGRCSHCGNRHASLPAQMMDQDSIARVITEAVRTYVPDRPHLNSLVRLLFIYSPHALQVFDALGSLTLDDLRRDDQALA